MTDWLSLTLAVLALAGGVVGLLVQRRNLARLRSARAVARVARYQLARELRQAGHVDAAHVALTVADQLDAALDGRL